MSFRGERREENNQIIGSQPLCGWEISSQRYEKGITQTYRVVKDSF